MKKLTVFSIKSFAGPFIVTFFISMFMLILQFTWLYIDDLMGKGLSIWVILELLLYVSASLIPLALPLSILLSSIMTLGNLAESNELTALKSSGLSLIRILRPLTRVVIMLSIGTFFFFNYVIPVANLKWRTMIYDIQSTKVSLLLTPGAYSNQIDGFSIKVDKGSDNSFKGITIHDYTDPNILKTVKADSGTIYNVNGGKNLLFHLFNGKVHEELQAQSPVFTEDGKVFHDKSEFRPKRFTSFKQATYKFDLVGFDLEKSREELFANQYEMLNVFQINYARDSIQRVFHNILTRFANENLNTQPYFSSLGYEKSRILADTNPKKNIDTIVVPPKVISLTDLTSQERINAVELAIVNLRNLRTNVSNQQILTDAVKLNFAQCEIEFHRKFALSGAIILLFFVGAPLGAIVRKGGFGAPVVIAALLFMVYFIVFSVGESLANSYVLSPALGMWMPSFVLFPFAIILMISAMNDLPVFSKKLWLLILTFGRKR